MISGTKRGNKRRSPYEIAASIIHAASPDKKTRIMYASHLNMALLNRYLKSLTEHGLISNSLENNTYGATSKGLQYLRAFQEYEEATQLLGKKEKVMKSFFD